MSAGATVVGASGYVGGELLRLLESHPEVEIRQAISRSQAGRYLHGMHPNLRGQTNLRFSPPEELASCDVLFLALPHGQSAHSIERYADLAEHVVDCSADFRLSDRDRYRHWYGEDHPATNWQSRFVYGLPERRRDDLRGARFASGVGCNAVAMILGLAPLADGGHLERACLELKVGSSEAGVRASSASHHPERSGAVRVYRPYGHRHLAEVEQELDGPRVHAAVTAIEMVRGVHMTAHCFLTADSPLATEKDVWSLYRQAYQDEPFVRLVAAKRGLYRYPEPKILAGSNYCDIGFALEAGTGVLVVMTALDNLVKGAAGTAVQAMNLMAGWDERSGLTTSGLHPV